MQTESERPPGSVARFAVTLCFVSADFEAALKDLGGKLAQVEAVMDLDALRREVAELEEEAARPDLWNDPEVAQRVTSQLSHKQASLRKVSELRQRVDDLGCCTNWPKPRATRRVLPRRRRSLRS